MKTKKKIIFEKMENLNLENEMYEYMIEIGYSIKKEDNRANLKNLNTFLKLVLYKFGRYDYLTVVVTFSEFFNYGFETFITKIDDESIKKYIGIAVEKLSKEL